MGKIRKRVLNLILSIFWAIVYFAYLLIFILVVFANFGYNDAKQRRNRNTKRNKKRQK